MNMIDSEILRLPDVLGILRKWAEEGWASGILTPSILADKLQDHGFTLSNFLATLRSLSIDSEASTDLDWFKDVVAGVPAGLDGYDWVEAFKYAGQPDVCPPGADIPTHTFDRADVAVVIAVAEGESDELDWVCFGRLRDQRFFVLRAGCGYTGWDVSPSGSADVGFTYDDVLWHGLTDNERLRLNLQLPTEGQ